MFNFYSQLELILGHEIHAKFMFFKLHTGKEMFGKDIVDVDINIAGKKYSMKELLRCSQFTRQR
jgi:hypothetical protein